MDNQNEPPIPQDEDPQSEADYNEAQIVFGEAIREFINNDKIVTAIAALINAKASQNEHAKIPTAEEKFKQRSYFAGLGFGLAIFIIIALLACHKVINDSAATGLMGALISAWWRQNSK